MTDTREYSTRITPLLRADPVAHHPLATVLDRALGTPVVGQNPDDRWALVVDGGAVAGVALHRPPGPAYLGRMSDTAVGALVGLLAEVRPDLPGVYGPEPTVGGFVTFWGQLAGQRAVQERSLGVWTLDSADDLDPTAFATGELRPARPDDLPLLREWAVDRWRDGALLWETGGRPVAMASVSRPLHGVAELTALHTPPDLRHHGYGKAVAAAASRHALGSGADRCLFYDLADRPVASHLVEEIGYRRAAEMRRYAFTPSNTARPDGLSMTGTTTAAPRHAV